MTKTEYDIFVIGGGINGAGIAADAAGRGLNVGLCEMNDLASATSSYSSKLIHGGLRYLEHYEFRLVREALNEREVLLKIAPHIVSPMRFQMPHRPHLRPAWLIRIGLFLYDNLAKRETLAGSKGVKYDEKSALKPIITKGFEYSDCSVDDARLVVLNVLTAQKHGAQIYDRTQCIGAKRVNGIWQIELKNSQSEEVSIVTAKALVNAAGPWVSSVIKEKLQLKPPYGIRMIKGSHIVVPKFYDQTNAFIMQNEDGRIVFAIPYNNDYTLIGTTDEEYHGDPSKVAISEHETDYLIEITNKHFKHQISKDDIIWTYSGVRPLLEDESDNPSAVTRDYTLSVEDDEGKAPLLSVFGGKITTYRQLALSAMKDLGKYFPKMGKAWTHTKPLPGGDLSMSLTDFTRQKEKEYFFLPKKVVRRYAKSYGTLCNLFMAGKSKLEDMGVDFGHGLFQAEVDYLVKHEWALNAEDILWRRSKLGIVFSEEETLKLEKYLAK